MNSSGNIENFISIIEDIVDVHLKIIHMKYNSHANFDLGKYFRRENIHVKQILKIFQLI